MSRKKQEQERRIRLVAAMIPKYSAEALVRAVMKRLGVSEAAALTYIKRANHQPNPARRSLDRLPKDRPLTLDELDTLETVAFSLPKNFKRTADNRLVMECNSPEQAEAMARWAREASAKYGPQGTGKLTPKQQQSMLTLAAHWEAQLKEQAFHASLCQALEEAGCHPSEDGSTPEFPSREALDQFVESLPALKKKAIDAGLPPVWIDGLDYFVAQKKQEVEILALGDDLQFFMDTMKGLVLPGDPDDCPTVDFGAFQSPEQKDTFKNLARRFQVMLATPDGSKTLQAIVHEGLPRTRHEEAWAAFTDIITTAAEWAKQTP